MAVAIEELTTAARRMVLVIPDSDVREQVTVKLHEISKTAQLKGFRKGKIPFKVVESRFKSGVLQEVLGELVQHSTQSHLQESGIVPVGQPEVEDYRVNDAEDHEFTVGFEVVPTVDVTDIAGKHVTCPQVTISDEEVKEHYEHICEVHHLWRVVERPAQLKDKVSADLHFLKDDGEIVDTNKSASMVLGGDEYRDEIQDACLNLEAGQEVSIPYEPNVAESKDDRDQDIGQITTCKIKIEKVEEPLDSLDRDVLASWGINSEDDSELHSQLRRYIRLGLEREGEVNRRKYIVHQIMMHLLEANPIDPPNRLVIDQVVRKMVARGMKAEQAARLIHEHRDDPFMQNQVGHVAVDVVYEIVYFAALEKHGIAMPSQDELESYIRSEADMYFDPEDAYSNFKESTFQVSLDFRTQRLTELLLADAECEDIEMNGAQVANVLREMMQPASTDGDDSADEYDSADDGSASDDVQAAGEGSGDSETEEKSG